MNRKILLLGLAVLGLVIAFSMYSLMANNSHGRPVDVTSSASLSENNRREPIIINSSASFTEMSVETLITESDAIVIGSVDKIHPSRWNTADGQLPGNVTVHTITPDQVIFTDVNFRIDRILKASSSPKIVRIRSLGGMVQQDQMMVGGEATLDMGNTYLLFLVRDTGSTAEINPGHYFVNGGLQGLYQFSDGQAISFRDSWVIGELLAYIENALSAETLLPPTELPADAFTSTPEATELPIETASPTP